MRYLVISDTHGATDVAEMVFKSQHSIDPIDEIIHLGDYYRDAMDLARRVDVPVTAVKGNMDGSFSSNDYKILETEFGNIYLAHGHMESVKFSNREIMYKADALGCKAVFYGHTHVPFYTVEEGLYVLNPGSLGRPAGGRKGSYAIVTVEKDQFSATILYVDQAASGGPASSGRTRSSLLEALNYSDRF
ncbi:MAG: metallophosphoesterase [Clostridiales bacterium]|nr:metallophosphoesterase [Clostridiales bacterium]